MSIELKQAAQQALEVLESGSPTHKGGGHSEMVKTIAKYNKAVTDLRAAIQQAEAPQPVMSTPFVVEVYDPISDEWTLAHSSPFWTLEQAQHAATCIRHTTRVRPYTQSATAAACGIPGMAKTTCPYCDQEFAFEYT